MISLITVTSSLGICAGSVNKLVINQLYHNVAEAVLVCVLLVHPIFNSSASVVNIKYWINYTALCFVFLIWQ